MRYYNGVFTGTLRNNGTSTARDVRVEIHLSNGRELGPTQKTSLNPGQLIPVRLDASGQRFTMWTVHIELGSGEHG